MIGEIFSRFFYSIGLEEIRKVKLPYLINSLKILEIFSSVFKSGQGYTKSENPKIHKTGYETHPNYHQFSCFNKPQSNTYQFYQN